KERQGQDECVLRQAHGCADQGFGRLFPFVQIDSRARARLGWAAGNSDSSRKPPWGIRGVSSALWCAAGPVSFKPKVSKKHFRPADLAGQFMRSEVACRSFKNSANTGCGRRYFSATTL